MTGHEAMLINDNLGNFVVIDTVNVEIANLKSVV